MLRTFPPRPDESGAVNLDAARIASVMADTERVSSILGAIFQEDEPEEETVDVTENVDHGFAGLDVRHSAFLGELLVHFHWERKVIEVTQDRTGTPPPFGGGGGLVHDGVVRKMKVVLSGKGMPAYLDKTAAELLEDARSEFHRMGLDHRSICESGENVRLVTTWAGTIKTSTLSLKLRSVDFKAVDHDGFLEVEEPSSGQTLVAALEAMAEQTPDDVAGESLSGLENMMSEKFHRYLSPDLLPCVAQNLLRRWCVRVGRYSIRFGARL